MGKIKKSFITRVSAIVLALTLVIGTVPNGVTTVFANNDDVVAKIGETEYTSLEAALADVPVGNSKETPAEATVIELCQDTAHSFDVGTSNGTKPKNIELRLNDNTLTLKPAVGSTGTVSNGIRVLAYSKLTITNGNVICSSEEDDNVKVGIANYGELILDGVNVQSGALTQYTVNNRGALTLKGDTIVQNGQVAPNDYSDSTGLVAITNDPYDMYYSTPVDAVINCDSEDVVVGNIQIERYTQTNRNEKGDNVLNISAGSFGSVIIPEESSDTGIDVVGNITGGSFEAASGAELQNVMDLTVAGTAYQTPEKAVSIKLTDDVENGFDVGNANGTAPKYFKLDLNGKTITLRPAVGSVGTVSSGIRVLAYSKLEISNGNVVCSDAVEDNIKVGIANYGTLGLDSVNVQSGALTIYTINNRGELTLSGETTVENAKVAHKDYEAGSEYVAITNDPYTLYYTNDAVINCDSKDVKVDNIQLETYGSAGNIKLNISNGSFGEIVAPTVSESDKVKIFGSITGGQYGNDVSEYIKSGYWISSENGTYTVAEKLVQDSFGFETPNPVDQWVGESYINKVTGVQGTGTTTYSVIAGEDVASVDATTGEVTFLKVGTVTIQANNTGDAQYLSATATYSVTSIKNSQDIFKFETTGPVEVEWEPNGIYQNVAIGGSGDGEVSYKILEDNGVATIDPGTGVVTFIKAGEVKVQAIKADDGKYLSTDTTYILKIKKIGQEELIIDSKKVITYSPDWQEAITVSGGSGEGKVKFEIPEEYAEYAEIDPEKGLIKTNRYGTIKVLISKEGDDNYNAVETTEVIIEIEHAEQTDFKFTVEEPDAIIYGYNNNKFINIASGGQTENAPTYAISSGDAATIDETTGELTIEKAGTVTVTATKLGDERYETVIATYTLDISYLKVEDSVRVEISGDTKNTSGWYTGDVTFTAPDDYKISKSNALENSNVWSDSVTYGTEGTNDVIYYLRNSEGYITDAITYEDVKIDKTSPEIIEVYYSESIWDEIIEEITFGFYKAPVTITVTAQDEISGVEHFELTYEKKNGLPNETYVSDVNIDTYTITLDAVQDEEDKNKFTATHKIPAELLEQVRGSIYVKVVDNAGNDSEKADENNVVIVDTISPTINVTYTTESPETKVHYVDENLANIETIEDFKTNGYQAFYNGDVKATIQINEANFFEGIKTDNGEVIHKVGILLEKTYEDGSLEKIEFLPAGSVQKYDDASAQNVEWSKDGDVYSFEIPYVEDADYVLTVDYVDFSENKATTSADDSNVSKETQTYISKIITVDTKAPIVKVEYDNKDVKNTIDDRQYFDATQTAKITVKEHNFRADEVELTVEAEDICENPVDISAKNYFDYAKNPENWTSDGDVHTLNTDGMKFDVEAIYHVEVAYTDLAENAAQTYVTDFVVDKTDAYNIKIGYSESLLNKVIEKITFGFYKTPVTITVTAQDEISGVKHFELTYEKKNGLPNETYVSDVNIDTYTITLDAVQDEEDKNKFTATHKIPAELLEQARGSISVKVVDKAGNPGNDSEKVDENNVAIVDTISPTINVTYTTDSPETKVRYVDENLANIETIEDFKTNGYQAFYNGDVKATIQINEANFFEGIKTDNGEVIHKVGILLEKTYEDGNSEKIEFLPAGSVQKYEDASAQNVEWSKDGDVYSFEIPYVEDADYVLTVDYVDFSENKATTSADDSNVSKETQTYISKIITVDTTAPIVNVEYENKDVKNTIGGRQYFDAIQTAKITVEEHNFRADEFVATIVAEDVCGENVKVEDFAKTLATRENWKKDGNTHTIEIEYSVDANYIFDYTYVDLAQNAAAEYEEDLFTVDTVSPEVVSIDYKETLKDVLINNLTFNYFAANVEVTVTLKDETAGINEFDYEGLLDSNISAKNKAVLLTAVENADIMQQEDKSQFVVQFTIPKEALTELNSFRGTVRVNAWDYSDNTVQKHDETRLVVDKIAPTCQVTFDKQVNDVEGVSYYDKAFTATITIDEANFYAEDVVINVNGSRVTPTDWALTEGTDIWTSHVSFTEEGDYILTVDYTDRSGNVMTSYESNQKTLDTTEPVINVTNIKHESANNEETIGFVVTITDKNLISENVKPQATAVVRYGDNSSNYTYETIDIDLGTAVVDTNANGETVYTYTVTNLESDGYYSLLCTVVDNANHTVSSIGAQSEDNHGVAVEAVNFSVNREGSVFWIKTTHYDKYSKKTYEDELNGAYANDEVTVELHEVNVDRVDELADDDKRTVLTLNDGNDANTITLVEDSDNGGNYERNVRIGDGGWYETIYTLNNDQFAKDGTYSLNIITYDKAENSNVNTNMKNDEGTIQFVVDRTNPVIITNVKSKQIIDANEYTVELTIAEVNLDESTLVVKLDGKETELTKVSSNTYQFTLDEAQWANFPRLSQNFEITAKDLAGNSAEVYQREDITVTDDVIIQVAAYMMTRLELLFGAGAGIVAIAGLIIFLIVRKKHKKDEDKA